MKGIWPGVLAMVASTVAAAQGTVIVQRGADAGQGESVADCYLWSDSPQTNSGTSSVVYSGYSSGTKVGLFRFDVAAVPPHSRVVSATLRLNCESASGATQRVHAASVAWSELTATWALWDGGVFAAPVEQAFDAGAGVALVELTPLVQRWVDGEPNLGIVVEQTPIIVNMYSSSESPTVANRPRLEVTWEPRDAGGPGSNGGAPEPPPARLLVGCESAWGDPALLAGLLLLARHRRRLGASRPASPSPSRR